MTLLADILTDMDIFFDTDGFSVPATYRVRGAGSGTAVLVILDQVKDFTEAAMSRGEGYYAQQGRLWCRVADVASPVSGDVVTIAGKSWIVQEILGSNGAAWELVVYQAAFAGKIK